LSFLLIRHGIEPGLTDITGLRVGLLVRLESFEITPLLCERCPSKSGAIERSFVSFVCTIDLPVRRLDDFDRGQFERNLRLTREESRLNLIDLDIYILLHFGIRQGCAEIFIMIGILIISENLRDDLHLTR